MTIDKIIVRNEVSRYRLKLPNLEVFIALNTHFLNDYAPLGVSAKNTIQNGLYDALEIGDLPKLKQHIQSLFAGVAWRNFTNNDLPDSEGYYASVLYAFLLA